MDVLVLSGYLGTHFGAELALELESGICADTAEGRSDLLQVCIELLFLLAAEAVAVTEGIVEGED